MLVLEIILLSIYCIIIVLGMLSVFLKLNGLSQYRLNSTQQWIQYLSFASLSLTFLWGLFYLPWLYLFLATLTPLLIIFLFKSYYRKFETVLLKYKFISDTVLIFLSIDLWILS